MPIACEPREPSHFLAQHGDLGRSEQIGEDQKAVALVLCQLRWRQLHRLLREPDAAALSVAPNGSGGARYQESKALAHRELPMTTPQPFAYFAATADFKSGKGTPRDFLERCLALLEQFEPFRGELEWPVAGTTGYDFVNAANALFVDPPGYKALEKTYGDFTGRKGL